MSEMVDDSLEALDEDNDELEEEAEQEVEGVLFEITDGKLGQAGKVGGKLPVRRPPSLDDAFALTLTEARHRTGCCNTGSGRGRSRRCRTYAGPTRRSPPRLKSRRPSVRRRRMLNVYF